MEQQHPTNDGAHKDEAETPQKRLTMTTTFAMDDVDINDVIDNEDDATHQQITKLALLTP